MPTDVSQKKFGGSSSQRGFANTVVASTVGTLIPEDVPNNSRITQDSGYRITQNGGYRIIQ